MRRTYLLWHWGLTLFAGPFISQLIEFIFGPSPHQVVGLMEFYPLSFIFSAIFSLPTFFIYCGCFYFLRKKSVIPPISKTILIAIAVAGICITQSLVKGSMSQQIIIAYSTAAIIAGLAVRLKKESKDEKCLHQ